LILLLLDGVSAESQGMSEVPLGDMPEMIRDLPVALRIGLAQVSHFRIGRYWLGNDDLEETDDQTDPSVFDLDSKTVCIVDLDHVGLTARALIWDRYDAFLRSQMGDSSIWIDIVEQVSGPFFGMLNGDVSTPFRGDGSYRLKANTPHSMNS
jgi:hypothetical protein